MAPSAIAIAEDRTEDRVAPCTFISKSPNQVLTRRSARHVEIAPGVRAPQGERDWIEAQKRKNEERELSGLQPLPVDDTPWRVEFKNHLFKTDHPALIEWLRNHRAFNITGPSSFYEQGAAPDEPRPTLTEQFTKIATASAEADIDTLQAALKEERDTHNRVPVIEAAEAALRSFAGSDSESGNDATTGDGDSPSDPHSTD